MRTLSVTAPAETKLSTCGPTGEPSQHPHLSLHLTESRYLPRHGLCNVDFVGVMMCVTEPCVWAKNGPKKPNFSVFIHTI